MTDFVRDAEPLPSLRTIRVHTHRHAALTVRDEFRVWTMNWRFITAADTSQTCENIDANRKGWITECSDMQVDQFLCFGSNSLVCVTASRGKD
jgi:hypothetical protein